MLIAGPGGAITYYDDAEVAATTARQESARTWERTWELWRAKAKAELAAEARLGRDERSENQSRILQLWQRAAAACGCGRRH
jgi:hypothetical protein